MVPPPSLIQDEGVRRHLLLAAFVVLPACAHARDEGLAAESPSSGAAEPVSVEREVLAVDSAETAPPAPAARPRLSQTITLGQGAEQQYTPSAPPSQAGGQGQGVVVNNNIVVQGGAPGYVGYGGYRSYGGYGRATTFVGNDGRSGHRGTPQWGSSGWEGARRTAAPGQTPGIGGNWSPPPSYGPAQMK